MSDRSYGKSPHECSSRADSASADYVVLFLNIPPGLPTAPQHKGCRDVDLETLVYRVRSDVELPASPEGKHEAWKALGPVDQGRPPFHMLRRAMLAIATAVCLPEK